MNQDTAVSCRARAVLIGFPLVVAVILAVWVLHVHGVERTDDAYVAGNIVQVTSQVGGTVVSIGADDTDTVSAGQAVVTLNAVDNEVQYDRAVAALAAATRQTRMLFHQVDQLKAEVQARQSDLERASNDVRRRKEVLGSGAVSKEELDHAVDVQRTATNALEATRQQLAQRTAMTDGLTLGHHPDVLAAASRLRDAFVALRRTTIVAPVTGTVSRRTVQVGQHIAAGASLMSVVPTADIWVDANFKESQLASMRVGQKATVTSDVYGSNIVFHGTVVGLDAGTGSAFALLPAQNATGNWIKVTQRVPVRIALDVADVRRSPLRLGMSLHVAVVTPAPAPGDQKVAAAPAHAYGTKVFDEEMKDADALVTGVISANAGTSREN